MIPDYTKEVTNRVLVISCKRKTTTSIGPSYSPITYFEIALDREVDQFTILKDYNNFEKNYLVLSYIHFPVANYKVYSITPMSIESESRDLKPGDQLIISKYR